MACASLVLGGVIKSSMSVAASAFHLLCLYILRSRCTSSALPMN
ncbi:BnaC03g64620D [Brassica napus]|uniref:BnaC03g64620D protein n=1 Tax=Brassica napus TaxID=3708 RepID=A0A078GQE2_BRANA|nr:BnaC03g64620D [Brassica napus]